MDEFNWEQFLHQWNEHLLRSSLSEGLAPEVRLSGWLGYPPATEDQIAAAEKRLGVALPTLFRGFLKASNGWRCATHAIDRIWGTDELVWFRKQNRDWIAAYTRPVPFGGGPELPDEAYFSYGPSASDFRRSHLKETLQISDVGDSAVYLLNPQVISSDGEWEAWFFANWLPGVHRYRSFVEMMQAEFHRLGGVEWKQPAGVLGPLPDEYTGSPGNPKRRVKKRKKPGEEKVLGKRLKEWSVDELLEMLDRKDLDIIHGFVLDALGKLGDQRAVEPLLTRLPESIHALRMLAPERLREPLLEMLRRMDAFTSYAVVPTLAELKEMRAVPLLVEAIQDVRPEAATTSGPLSQHMAAFGEAGFAALVSLLEHEHPVVRQRAVQGLLCADNARAAQAIRPLLHDPDPDVRQSVEIALTVLPAR
jgi:hypothetical protein